jgi:VCBS repeat-containing protein
MWATSAALVLAGCLAAPTPASDPDARPPAARCTAGSADLLAFTTPRSWQGAASACRDVDGELAIVRTDGDRAAVRALIDSSAWLGTVDLDSDGEWHHVDGSDASPDWGQDEPSAAPDDQCVAIHSDDGKDHAEDCARMHAYVCGCDQ